MTDHYIHRLATDLGSIEVRRVAGSGKERDAEIELHDGKESLTVIISPRQAQALALMLQDVVESQS